MAARPARAAGGQRGRASSPAARWPTSPAWPPRRDAVLRRAGWDVATDGLTGAPAGPGAGRRGAARHRRPGAALPRPRRARPGRRRRPGPARRGRPRGRAGRAATARRSSACRPATCTPARSTRSPRRSRSPTSTAPGCTSTARSGSGRPPPRRYRHLTDGLRRRRLVGDRRAQDPQRALRLRHRDRPRPGRAPGRDGHARRLPDPRRGRRPVRQGAGAVPAGPRRPGLGGARVAGPAAGSPTWSSGWPATRAAFAAGIAAIPGAEVLNDVVFTQVCVELRRRRAHPRGRRPGCSPTARPGCPARAGAAGRCCGSR